jgi:hypothetical protein
MMKIQNKSMFNEGVVIYFSVRDQSGRYTSMKITELHTYTKFDLLISINIFLS